MVQCSAVWCVLYCQRLRDLVRRMNQSVSQSVGQRVSAALPTVQYKTAAYDNTDTNDQVKSFTTATLNFMEHYYTAAKYHRNQKIVDLPGENLFHCMTALFIRLNSIPDSVRGPKTKNPKPRSTHYLTSSLRLLKQMECLHHPRRSIPT